MAAPVTEDGGGTPRALALTVLALIAFRIAIVLSLGDVFFYGDELEKGAAAKAMLDGLGAQIGHHRLAYHYYEGGGFVVSHLDALAFLLVGASLWALKLVAIAFDVAILLAGWSLASRAFGGRAAVLFGLLFVLAPESVQKNSLLALGIHWQALVFVLVVLDRGGRIALDGDSSRANWLLLGLAGGFGTYFNYQVAPALAFAGLAILVRRPRLLVSRPALWGWGGLAVGLIPLGVMVSLVGDQVLDIHGASLIGGDGKWSQFQAFLGSIYLGRTPLDLAAVVLVPASAVVGFAALCRSSARPWALYVGGYALLFFAAYFASSFTVGEVRYYFLFHRLSQLWILGALLAAGGLASLRARGGGAGLVGGALALALLIVGARGAFDVMARGNTVDFSRNWRALNDTKGYRFDHYVDKLWSHLDGDDREKVAALQALDDELVDYTLGVNLFGPRPRPFAQVRRDIEALGLSRPDQAVLALGPMWREQYPGSRLPERRAAVLANEEIPGDLLPLVEESFGRFGLGFQVRADRVREELRTGLVHGFGEDYFRGLGYRLYSVLGDLALQGYWRQTATPYFVDHDRALAFIGEQSARVRPLLLEGFHRAVAEHSLR